VREIKQQMTNAEIRRVNASNLLTSMIAARERTRGELAAQNDVSVMTVKKIVDELLALGLLQEKTLQDAAVGRKPKLLSIPPKWGAFVCLSLTSKLFFSYVLYNLYGEIIEERQWRLDEARSYRENLDAFIRQICADVGKSNLELIGVGASVPSAYYSAEDRVNGDLIPALKDIKLKALLTEAFHIENVLVAHDVFVAAQSEYDARAENSMFYFYVGDGVGGALIDRGNWHTGENRLAGEVGQWIIHTSAGERTFESCVSVPALLAAQPGVRFLELLQMADEGVTEAVAALDRAAETIAQVLYNVAWVLNPQSIVVGSSYQRYAERIVAACTAYNKRLTNLPIRMKITVEQSGLNKYGDTRGCFHLLRKHWVDKSTERND